MMESRIKGWCPTPLRPMESGDGWLARLYPRPNGWSGADLGHIARWSKELGNGQIEITQRCNLQLRGLTPGSFAVFSTEAQELGLIDPVSTLAVIQSPSGIFDEAAADCSIMRQSLWLALAAFPAEDFPAKFLIVLDGGGAANLSSLDADIRIAATDDRWSLSLCGNAVEALPAAFGDEDHMLHVLKRLLQVYPSKDKRGKGQAFAQHWALVAGLAIKDQRPFSALEKARDGARLAALRPAFGRISPTDLEAIAWHCTSEAMTLTTAPQRMFLLPHAHLDSTARLAQELSSQNFIFDTNDLRYLTDVCSGAPHCVHAERTTLKDAVVLASHFADQLLAGERLHISGCEKGCAHPAKAAMTLAAHQGQYRFMANATAAEAAAKGTVFHMPTGKAA
jgi:precorrin-3B synthase